MALLASSDACNPQYQAGPSRPMMSASRALCIPHACFLEQSEGVAWFGSQDETVPRAQSYPPDRNASKTLSDSYAETLWLGEHHTGLAHFLRCIDRLKSSHGLDDILLGLCELIRSSNTISQRHQALARDLQSSSESLTDSTTLCQLTECEMTLAKRVFDAAVSGISATEVGILRDRWVSSMQSREIQLQILITMCLLHIASQDPRALETARSRIIGSGPTNMPSFETMTFRDGDREQPQKRSRKLEKAKRWRGTRPSSDSSDVFAWNQKVRRLATDSSHDDGDSGECEVLETEGVEVLAVDHLSKRLEALVDILCLRQVAAGIGSEIGDLLSDICTESMPSDMNSRVKTKARGVLFGSSVRKLVEDDDMDDAQWLCSSVVEPHFEASLPRQCSLFRSKCFVSLQSRTPARPSKGVRPESLGSPPMQVAKRNASVIAAGASSLSVGGAGLSDVLEKEQAGRRVKRNILAERSSVLGRGREVDMGRRLSRSVSATLGPSHEARAATGVFLRSSTNGGYTQPHKMAASKPLNAQLSSQRMDKGGDMNDMRSLGLTAMASFSASASSGTSSATNDSKRLLVMSTPQRESNSKTLKLSHLSQVDRPRLVFPSSSLVMESPTQNTSHLVEQRSRTAERCASFAGRSSFALNRSPSPLAMDSDADE